jgi:FkbM family methyltransferase
MDDVRPAKTWVSRYVCTEILKGRTYPPVESVDGIQMIIDVGAKVGASTVYFSHLYPQATIHACEPAAAACELLRENTRELRSVFVWQIGLDAHDGTEALYAGADDSVASSLVRSKYTSDQVEMVRLRSARDWLDENNIGAVLTRLDVVICEQVLEHVEDPRTAVADLRRLTRPSGRVVVSTPFLIRVHELEQYEMHDYWRFTPRGLPRLLEDAGLVVDDVGDWGNRWYVLGNLGHWSSYRRWHTLRREPGVPVQVWAFARNPD